MVAETPLSFLQHLKDITFIERRPLRLKFIFLVSLSFADQDIDFVLNVYNL